MTFGEITWLLLGAAIGAIAACAIPYAVGLLARLLRKPASTSGAQPEPAQRRSATIPLRSPKSGHQKKKGKPA
jgi:hypothetical protein